MDASPVNEPPVGAADGVEPLAPLVPSAPPQGVKRRGQSGSRWPLWLAISVGVLSLLCVGGLGIGYHYYDKATKPNRSAPDVVVDNYLQAFLVDRDDKESSQFTCKSGSGLTDFKAFRDGFISRETELSGDVAFQWGKLERGEAPSGATITTNITVDTSGGLGASGRSSHEWIFQVIQSSGWRVCSASAVG